MAYKIGEVAALLGLTPEAIRHYERFGIIEPHKDGQSAYRYFDGWDLILLSAWRPGAGMPRNSTGCSAPFGLKRARRPSCSPTRPGTC